MNPANIKVLMISSDRKMLDEGSSVKARMAEYGNLVLELHIILLSDKSHGLVAAKIAPNVWVYPTNSVHKILRHKDAGRMGKKLVFDKKFIRGESLITAQDPFECGSAGLEIKKKWRLPLEIQLHTDPFSALFTGFLNNLRKKMAGDVLANADSVRVVSKALEEKIRAFTKAPIYVLPIFVDIAKVEEGRVEFDLHVKFGWHFIMLTVARLTEEKNLGMALEVLAGVRQSYPNTGLVIVGGGPLQNELKKKAKKLGVDNNVAFEGWQENLASYYKTANLYIQTSLYEGYGLSLVEAGLSGLPVISTPVGIAQEFENGKDAFIFPVDAEGKFVSAAIDLIENSGKREYLRTNMLMTLGHKLLTKDEYLVELLNAWTTTAKRVIQ